MPLSETLLIVMALLALAILAAGLLRRLPIPYTVVLVLIGMAVGELARSWQPLADLQAFKLSPDLVFFLFLPALIFESAFNLNARQLLKDLVPVFVLAVPALLISTALVALGMWWILGVDPMLACLFGALISATDPVAVIGVFKELGAPLRLTVLVEGESLLNDATAIVLFSILLGIAAAGGQPTWQIVLAGVMDFIWVFIGGLVTGLVTGLALSELLCRLRSSLSAILAMSVVMAYVSFIVAEHILHVSGVMAAAAAAISLSGWGIYRLPPGASRAIGDTWELIALMCNSLLFLLVGLSVESAISELTQRIDLILLVVALVLAARAAVVYSLVPLTTKLFSLPKITLGERHIMWWGGLKGGLAIAIVLTVPDDMPGRGLLLDLTLGVVVFTLLVNAPTIRPLIRKLGLDQLTPDERAELAHSVQHAKHLAHSSLVRFETAALISQKNRDHVARVVDQALDVDDRKPPQAQARRELYLKVLRTEFETLQELYDNGIVSQYIFFNLRSLLQRDRDRQSLPSAADSQLRPSVFLRIEMALLRRLREQDWATGVLSRYQNARLTQRLQHNIAGILMCEAVLQMLGDEYGVDSPVTREIHATYTERMARRRASVAELQQEFPTVCGRFELQLATRAALTVAQRNVEHDHHHGELGAKAYGELNARFDVALSHLPNQSPVAAISVTALLETVPLFQGLSTAAIDAVAKRARPVNFLSGDTVIGEGDKGDALYIISRGRVRVRRRTPQGDFEPVGELGPGEFFGETGLLGDHTRTATVDALQPSTLIRITRRDMLALADDYPEVKAQLNRAHAERRGSDAL